MHILCVQCVCVYTHTHCVHTHTHTHTQYGQFVGMRVDCTSAPLDTETAMRPYISYVTDRRAPLSGTSECAKSSQLSTFPMLPSPPPPPPCASSFLEHACRIEWHKFSKVAIVPFYL